MSPDPTLSSESDHDVPTQVVAIDGPAGAGKSTVARALAAALGWAHLDTGAMFRAVTLQLLAAGALDPPAADRVDGVLGALDLQVDELGRVLIDGVDVTSRLREPPIEAAVSTVATLPAVRAAMRGVQREFARRRPTVAEGRDIGTVVFPHAAFKFWLDASVAERARRRHAEFRAAGRDLALAAVEGEIRARDARDSGREHSPLARAADAVAVDTTGMSVAEVVARLHGIVTGDDSAGGCGTHARREVRR